MWFLGLFNVLLYSPFKLSQADEKLNSIRVVDQSCSSDADCRIKKVDCSVCPRGSIGGAVNKNYEPLCLFKFLAGPPICPAAMPKWHGLEAICENNKCVAKIDNASIENIKAMCKDDKICIKELLLKTKNLICDDECILRIKNILKT